ncbi:integrase [Mycolicibacterium aubagnense]|uniref:Integrase n=2 Tax=Mycolicibacterium aubagnense TaxID=319707 RepID=A0ABN5Z4F9_9MYCO|nr:site-specific integrase [Mycolicibacterium aubagnense]BBX87864.1 integrase [Mycolicibacterium aubagnense]
MLLDMGRIPDWVKKVETSAGRRYEVRVHAHRPDGTRFQNKKRFKTVDEAVEWRSTVISEVARGTHVSPTELTVMQAVDSWLLGQRIRPKTMSAYVTALRPLVDHLGDRRVQTITKDDIEAVVRALRDGTSAMGTWNAPQKIKGKRVRSPWAATSINPMLAHTRNVFADLVDQGILPRNVAALVKPMPTTRAKLMTLNAMQISTLLTSVADHQFGIGFRLALNGMRRGELLALRWSDVNFETGIVSISLSRLAIAGGSATGAPKTDSSVRDLPMPLDLSAALRRERKRQAEAKLRLGTLWKDTGLVVVDAFGKPPHPDTITHAWADALSAAKLPHVRLHDARHSCATLMHLNGVPETVIAAWLGHTDARFTLSVYTHSNNDALAAAAVKINSMLSTGTGSSGNPG